MSERDTIIPAHTRDPETGRINGAKISACRACGKTRMVSVASGLCGVRSCLTRRLKVAKKKLDQQRADQWLKRAMPESDEVTS